MNKTEATKIIASMIVMFNNYKPVDIDLAADIWADTMEEYTYEQVGMALKAYMKTSANGFAPTPGQLIEKIQLMQRPQCLNEMEAWALVYKAICNSGYNSVEEFAKLPTLVQKAVGLPDNLRAWALEENMNIDVVSSNFKSAYRQAVNYEREISKMPVQIRSMIEKANENSDPGRIEQMRQKTIENFRNREQTEKLLEKRTDGVEMPDRAKKRKEELFVEE